MTTAEMLAEVTAQIRKDIPRLMELREGCKLSFKDPYTPDLITIIDENNEEDIFYVIDEFYDVSEYKKDYVKGHYEILGHDIMLNDVLCWLQSLGLSMEIQSYNGENTIGLYYISIDEKGDAHEEYVTWNLLSSYLKDQSEKLIKFLYDLKQKIDE